MYTNCIYCVIRDWVSYAGVEPGFGACGGLACGVILVLVNLVCLSGEPVLFLNQVNRICWMQEPVQKTGLTGCESLSGSFGRPIGRPLVGLVEQAMASSSGMVVSGGSVPNCRIESRKPR